MRRSVTILISAGAGLALVAAGTAAGAAIAGPIDGSGVIYGCYYKANNAGSHTLVLQDVGTTCPNNTTAIKWNQTGPQGPAGPKGDTGATGPAGPVGATGAAGPAGATGPAGPAGADGKTVLNGTGVPASTVGNDGDFYLDTQADVLYGPKAGGSWPANGVSLVGATGATGPAGPAGLPGPQGQTGATGPAGPQGVPGPQGLTGPQGPAGANGNTVLHGTGAPGVSVGNDGDFYLDTAADVLYGPKAGGGWPVNGVSLVGAPGSPGTGATVTSLATGNANCPNGGAAVKDGSGTTAYACNGAAGPQGPAGTNQQPGMLLTQLPPTQLTTSGTQVGVAGLALHITPTANSIYLVNANIDALNIGGGNAFVSCSLPLPGGFSFTGHSQVMLSGGQETMIPVSSLVSVNAGDNVTIQPTCAVFDGGTVWLGSFGTDGGVTESSISAIYAGPLPGS